MSEASLLSGARSEQFTAKLELTGLSADSSNLNFLDVADRKKAKPQPAEKALTGDSPQTGDKQKDIMQSFANLPKEKLTPGLVATQAAVREFSAAPDKQEAIKTVGPKFDAANAQTDQDYVKAMAENWSGVKTAKIELERLQSLFMAGMQDVSTQVKALPQDKQEATQAKLVLLGDENTTAQERKAIREDLQKNNPNLLKTYDGTMKLAVQGATAEDNLAKAVKPLETAAYAQAASRYVAAKAYEMSGETSKSFLLKKEAQEIIANFTETVTGEKQEVKPALKV